MSLLTFDESTFYLDNEPFRIIAGDIHYFRIHPGRWEKTLDQALDFGLNTIQAYVPWNAHEPKPGQYDFSGLLDLGAFLALCQKKGLKVLLRPSPYICSEWDFGGLPAWLLKDRDRLPRSSDPAYLAAVERYYEHLLPVFLPYLSTNGGPIVAVAIENEYGSYGNDHAYLRALADMLAKGGVDVPFYTTDGDLEHMLTFGRFDPQLFFGVNYRALPGTSEHAYQKAKKMGPDKPFFIGELWSGRSIHWGEPFYHRDPAETSIAFKEALERGGNVCFYMFAGGTNFGFMGGANIGRSYAPRPGTPIRYIPHATTYDEDAPISESGKLTEKYFLCRDVLDEYLGKPRRPHTASAPVTQALSVTWEETADLFDNLDALTEAKTTTLIPRPMEEHGQSYGLILYRTVLEGFDEETLPLRLRKIRDRASLYVDGRWLATYMRDRETIKLADGAPNVYGIPAIEQNGEAHTIDILVENLGRVNYGEDMMDERKGMEDALLAANAKLFGYETRTLPLDDLSRLVWSKKPVTGERPCFYRSTFQAQSGVDTFVDFEKYGHGYIWINGFNLGRYDSAGPCMTLYVPGELLKQTDNEIVLLDIHPNPDNKSILLSDNERLEGEGTEL